MKFIIDKTSLLKALTVTGKGIPKTPLLPILGSYLFSIDNDTLVITAGSMEFFMSQTLEISGDGSEIVVAIPGSELAKLVKDLPDQPLSFNITSRTGASGVVLDLEISCITGVYVIPVEDGTDYPQFHVKDSSSFNIDYDILVSGIKKTVFMCGQDKLRVAMTGLFLTFSNGQAVLTGCNGSALSTTSIANDFESDLQLIIPVTILSVLVSTPSKNVMVIIGDRNIQFILDDKSVLKSVLIDERYPDYEAVIPVKNDKHVVINKSQFTGSLKRVSQFSETEAIKLTFESNKCMVSAENLKGANAHEEMSTQYSGEKIEIGMSGKLLLSCLSQIDIEEINLLLSTPNRAMLIREDVEISESKSDLMLVMPCMLNTR
jgi:DNA polymerase-3 subunit beta